MHLRERYDRKIKREQNLQLLKTESFYHDIDRLIMEAIDTRLLLNLAKAISTVKEIVGPYQNELPSLANLIDSNVEKAIKVLAPGKMRKIRNFFTGVNEKDSDTILRFARGLVEFVKGMIGITELLGSKVSPDKSLGDAFQGADEKRAEKLLDQALKGLPGTGMMAKSRKKHIIELLDMKIENFIAMTKKLRVAVSRRGITASDIDRIEKLIDRSQPENGSNENQSNSEGDEGGEVASTANASNFEELYQQAKKMVMDTNDPISFIEELNIPPELGTKILQRLIDEEIVDYDKNNDDGERLSVVPEAEIVDDEKPKNRELKTPKKMNYRDKRKSPFKQSQRKPSPDDEEGNEPTERLDFPGLPKRQAKPTLKKRREDSLRSSLP